LKSQVRHIWHPDEQETAPRHHIWCHQSLRPDDPDPAQSEGEWKVTRGAPQVVEGGSQDSPSQCLPLHSFHPINPEAPKGTTRHPQQPLQRLLDPAVPPRPMCWHWAPLPPLLRRLSTCRAITRITGR